MLLEPLNFLLVTVVVLGPLFGFLAVANYVMEARSLREHEVPRPDFVIWRRVRGVIAPPRASRDSVDLPGRLAWVKWDVRWVTSGQTMARVTGYDASTRELALRLSQPIFLHATVEAPAVELRNVRLVPGRRDRAAYARVAVPGRLEPAIYRGFAATAVTVVYPQEHPS